MGETAYEYGVRLNTNQRTVPVSDRRSALMLVTRRRREQRWSATPVTATVMRRAIPTWEPDPTPHPDTPTSTIPPGDPSQPKQFLAGVCEYLTAHPHLLDTEWCWRETHRGVTGCVAGWLAAAAGAVPVIEVIAPWSPEADRYAVAEDAVIQGRRVVIDEWAGRLLGLDGPDARELFHGHDNPLDAALDACDCPTPENGDTNAQAR